MLEITIADPSWKKALFPQNPTKKAIQAFGEEVLSHVFEATGKSPGNVAVLFTNDSTMQALNKQFREKDAPTNVLSFPYVPFLGLGNTFDSLGDIALGFETVRREALEQGKPFLHHATHLFIHGILHILGYDHIEEEEANTMEALEIEILKKFSIPHPYEDILKVPVVCSFL